MNSDFSEDHEINDEGNCVIVTTLMSFANSVPMTPRKSMQSIGKTPALSSVRLNSGCSIPLPHGLAQGPAAQLNDSTRFICLTDEKNCKTVNKAKDHMISNKLSKGSSQVDSYGPAPLGDEGRALFCVDRKSSRETSTIKRSTHLGPLVVVHRSPDVSGIRCRSLPPVTEVEQLSHHRALEHVRGQLTKAEAALAESHAAAELATRAQAESLEAAHRAEEQRLRQEFDKAFATIRAENDELAARTKAEELRAATAQTIARETVETEWISRLDKCERQWRERLHSAETQWEARVDAVLRQEQEALRQVQDLSHTVCELEAALRQATRERTWAEQERDKLMAQQQQRQELQTSSRIRSDERTELETEILTLRASLREAEVRERALLLQLESAGDETAVETNELELNLRQVRHELDAERANCGEIVKVYGDQLESMHTQLNDALRRNTELTEQMAKFSEGARKI